MRFIGSVIEKLQRHPKRIVFPEGTEPRVLQAARQFHSLRLGAPILLGDRSSVKAAAERLNLSMEGLRIINPVESEEHEKFAQRYLSMPGNTASNIEDARRIMACPNYFGAMLVAMHQTDGIVTGASEATEPALRPIFQIIKTAPNIAVPSSCMIVEVEDSRFGEKGVLCLADCGVIPDPSAEELADIAVETGMLARQLIGVRPRVAMLGYSTKSGWNHPTVVKVNTAVTLAREKAVKRDLDADFDGELQLDTALIPEIASRKEVGNKVAGHANVLVFPNLESGNIACKLLQHMARANAYGQVLLGTDRPSADVSRGSSTHDILGVAAIVGLQSIAYQHLYENAGQRLPGE